jgi:hypothetical protein
MNSERRILREEGERFAVALSDNFLLMLTRSTTVIEGMHRRLR